LIEEERVKNEELPWELERMLLYEDMSWRQKSKALWLREGDKNTKFFHQMANSCRRNNIVDSLMVNGSLSSDPIEIRELIVQFYTIVLRTI
jgi:hypothetical protein